MRARHLSVAGLALVGLGCIPSFPPCDVTKNDESFPDFESLDRSVDCPIPLPAPCLVGAEGCPCTHGGGCDPGLICEMSMCVSAAGDGDGDGDGDSGDGDGDETDTGTDTGAEMGTCGYPAGPYGFKVGDTFENLLLFDCSGNQVQIAQYLPQEGLPDVETRGVVFGVAALWCEPCRMEGTEWAATLVDEYAPQGIQFIQSLDEGAAGSPVLPASCAGWSTTVVQDKLPILYVDQVAGLRQKIELMANEPIPFTLIFDANAHITFRKTGGIVDAEILRTQIDNILNDPYGN